MSQSPEFPFIPDWAASISQTPRISKVEFGDGYTQRLGKGLNTMLEEVSVTFSKRTDEEAAAIVAFFEAMAGVTPFLAKIGFTRPVKRYVTEGEWSITYEQYSDNTVTATFQEVP